MEYLKITMTDVLVSSVQHGGSGDAPTDTVTLNFAQVTIDYTPQNSDGIIGQTVHGGWDIGKNTAA